MIDHKNWCSLVPTGYCNCQTPVGITRVESWTNGSQELTMNVNTANETVLSAYETMAALLQNSGFTKANPDLTAF